MRSLPGETFGRRNLVDRYVLMTKLEEELSEEADGAIMIRQRNYSVGLNSRSSVCMTHVLRLSRTIHTSLDASRRLIVDVDVCFRVRAKGAAAPCHLVSKFQLLLLC